MEPQAKTIGSIDRFVIDASGNVDYFESGMLALERATAVSDLLCAKTLGLPGMRASLRTHTLSDIAYLLLAELDDVKALIGTYHAQRLAMADTKGGVQ